MHDRTVAAVLASVVLAVLSGAAFGGEASTGSETLTGDWGGTRATWQAAGWGIEGGYKLDALRLVDGGRDRGGRAMGHLDLSVAGDLHSAFGWEGVRLFVNYVHDHGETFNSDRVGSLVGVSNIEVPVDTGRFFHAWLENAWDEGRFALLAGLYPIDSEFQVLETAALFVQPPYGPTGDLALTRGPSVFNTSAFGLRARWQSADSGLYTQAAVLDGVPGDPEQPKGTHVKFEDGDGTMRIAELGWQSGGEGVPYAKYAVGAWGYTARVDDLVDTDDVGNSRQRRSGGAYALAEGTLATGADGFELAGFIRYAGTDGNSTPIRWIVNTGLVVRAPFAGRPDDQAGVAYTRAALGAKYVAVQTLAGVDTQDHEDSWELTYRYQVTPWLAVQPVAQWYRTPGGDRAVPDATVLGARLEVSF